jgi:hypothetical protein
MTILSADGIIGHTMTDTFQAGRAAVQLVMYVYTADGQVTCLYRGVAAIVTCNLLTTMGHTTSEHLLAERNTGNSAKFSRNY